MSTEIFSKEQFENALPVGYWIYAGNIQGEHCYKIQITEDIFIWIRSSVKSNGLAADTGKDSIRAYLVDKEGKPLGSKVQAYVTRVSGWQIRLTDMLRELWTRAQKAGYCSECGSPKSVFKVKSKKSEYYGKIFAVCKSCGEGWTLLED